MSIETISQAPVRSGDNFLPPADATKDLGSSSFQWQDIWVDRKVVIGDSADNTGGLSLGDGPDSVIYYDGTDTFWDLRAVGTGDLMIALAASFPSPDTGTVHIWAGDAGAITADANAKLVIESSGETHLQFLSPTNATQAINFGDADSNVAGLIRYSHINDDLTIRIGSGTRLIYGVTAFAFQEATTISTTAGALTLDPTDELIITANNINLASGARPQLRLTGAGAGAFFEGIFTSRTSRGSIASPTASQSEDTLVSLSAAGYDGAGYEEKLYQRLVTSQTWTASAHGTELRFFTVADGATSDSQRWAILNSGVLQSNGAQSIETSSGDLTLDPTDQLLLGAGKVFQSAGAAEIGISVNNTALTVGSLGSIIIPRRTAANNTDATDAEIGNVLGALYFNNNDTSLGIRTGTDTTVNVALAGILLQNHVQEILGDGGVKVGVYHPRQFCGDNDKQGRRYINEALCFVCGLSLNVGEGASLYINANLGDSVHAIFGHTHIERDPMFSSLEERLAAVEEVNLMLKEQLETAGLLPAV